MQRDLQEQRALDFGGTSLKFFDIPVHPNEFSFEKLGFRGGKPNVKVSRKFN